ncbi:MAG: Imidazole glycerol phosphate synthase subunit HisF [Nitrospira sp.]|nr:Imidazole glycerol phosphate synthase subunit HisF [Nitrospira sp.]
MLKSRVIPTLRSKDFSLVKGIGFDSWRRFGTVRPAIKAYYTREVDELILVDITAATEERQPDHESVAEFSAECFVPLTVGGGIRSMAHITQLLRAGADKISINSAAYDHPELIQEASSRFGAQCIVASIDARRMPDGSLQCHSHSSTKPIDLHPAAWAAELERLGAGEILITSIERDGTMQGYDLDLIREVAAAVKIPVIASGGAGNYAHMLQAVREGGASAVAAASIFHFTQQTPLEAKNHLAANGVPVRWHG